MSQPPKSTMRAPLARWVALSGVIFGIEPLQETKRAGASFSLARPLCPWYLRDYGLAAAGPFGGRLPVALQSPGMCPGSERSFCLRVCGCYPFGGVLRRALPIGWDGLYQTARRTPVDVSAPKAE